MELLLNENKQVCSLHVSITNKNDKILKLISLLVYLMKFVGYNSSLNYLVVEDRIWVFRVGDWIGVVGFWWSWLVFLKWRFGYLDSSIGVSLVAEPIWIPLFLLYIGIKWSGSYLDPLVFDPLGVSPMLDFPLYILIDCEIGWNFFDPLVSF